MLTQKVERSGPAMFQALVETAADAVVCVDENGNALYVNKAAERLFGYRREEIAGRPLSLLMAQQHHEPCREGLRRFLETGESPILGKTVELTGRRKDGIEFRVEVSSSAWKTDGRAFAAGIFRDVSERVRDQGEVVYLKRKLENRASELARSNRELDQFAHVASHDLQEPLQAVSGFVQILGRKYKGRLDPADDEFIRYAVDGLQKMQDMIRDLLAYAQAGSGRKPFKPVDLDEVLEQVRANLRSALEESKAELTAGALPTVAGDRTRLVQLFQNLIGNAVKYRGAAPPKIDLTARRGKSEWIFSVRDNGIGIAPEHHERIFRIFQRLHPEGRYPGTGMGLALARRVVEQHGGRIWVESRSGKGATFTFTIPLPPPRG